MHEHCFTFANQLGEVSVYQFSADLGLIKYISSQLIWISGPAPEKRPFALEHSFPTGHFEFFLVGF
jgi:hypothetical protein